MYVFPIVPVGSKRVGFGLKGAKVHALIVVSIREQFCYSRVSCSFLQAFIKVVARMNLVTTASRKILSSGFASATQLVNIWFKVSIHNKTLKLTFWPSFRFVHGQRPFLHKTPLRPKCNLA